jgi:hypothetical protein
MLIHPTGFARRRIKGISRINEHGQFVLAE